MGMELADYGPKPTTPEQDEQRRAAVRIADQVASEHPHLTAREIADDPVIAAGFRELLAQLGLKPQQIRRRP